MEQLLLNAHGHHRTTSIKLNGRFVQIDHNIAELIQLLNKLGIRTFGSCGGGCFGRCHKGHKRGAPKPLKCHRSVAISFTGRQGEVERFMSLMTKYATTPFLQECIQGVGVDGSPSWHWPTYLDDVNDLSYYDLDKDKEFCGRKGKIKLQYVYCVIFPHEHYDFVVDCLRKELKKKLKRNKK